MSPIRTNAKEGNRAYRFFGAGILGSTLLHVIAIGGIVVLWHSRLTIRNIIPAEIIMLRTREGLPDSIKMSTIPHASQSVVGEAKKNPIPVGAAALEDRRRGYAFQAASEVINPDIASLRVNRAAKDAELHGLNVTDVINLLRAQIERCWFPPLGARPPNDLGIDVHIVLSIDGSIAEPPKLIVSGNNFDNNRAQAFVEAAQRAIYTCGPYKLPAADFSVWHEVDAPRFFPIER